MLNFYSIAKQFLRMGRHLLISRLRHLMLMLLPFNRNSVLSSRLDSEPVLHLPEGNHMLMSMSRQHHTTFLQIHLKLENTRNDLIVKFCVQHFGVSSVKKKTVWSDLCIFIFVSVAVGEIGRRPNFSPNSTYSFSKKAALLFLYVNRFKFAITSCVNLNMCFDCK